MHDTCFVCSSVYLGSVCHSDYVAIKQEFQVRNKICGSTAAALMSPSSGAILNPSYLIVHNNNKGIVLPQQNSSDYTIPKAGTITHHPLV